MISARAYSSREASILATYSDSDEFFSGSVNTSPEPHVLVDSRLGQALALIQERIEKSSPVVTFKDVLCWERRNFIVGATREVTNTWPSRIDNSALINRLAFGLASDSFAGTTHDDAEAEASIWCFKFNHYAVAGRTMEALEVLFQYVEDAFDVPDYQKLDCFLGRINPKVISAEMIISVLRSTSRAKSSLPKWNGLLDVAREKVREEGLPARLLRGL